MTKKLNHDVLSEEWGRELITKAAHHTIALPTTIGASSGGATEEEEQQHHPPLLHSA